MFWGQFRSVPLCLSHAAPYHSQRLPCRLPSCPGSPVMPGHKYGIVLYNFQIFFCRIKNSTTHLGSTEGVNLLNFTEWTINLQGKEVEIFYLPMLDAHEAKNNLLCQYTHNFVSFIKFSALPTFHTIIELPSWCLILSSVRKVYDYLLTRRLTPSFTHSLIIQL